MPASLSSCTAFSIWLFSTTGLFFSEMIGGLLWCYSLVGTTSKQVQPVTHWANILLEILNPLSHLCNKVPTIKQPKHTRQAAAYQHSPSDTWSGRTTPASSCPSWWRWPHSLCPRQASQPYLIWAQRLSSSSSYSLVCFIQALSPIFGRGTFVCCLML